MRLSVTRGMVVVVSLLTASVALVFCGPASAAFPSRDWASAAQPARASVVSQGTSVVTAPTKAAVRAQLLAIDRRSRYGAPRVLLDRFAVFSEQALHHRNASVAVFRPLLRSLPLGVLRLTSPDRVRRLDIHQIRQVRLGDGATFWVVPSDRGLCVYGQDPRPWSDTFGGCTGRLAQATSAGNSINLRLRDGKRIVAGVVPDTNRTLRVRTATGAIRSVPVIAGVYVVPTGLRHIYIKSVSATP